MLPNTLPEIVEVVNQAKAPLVLLIVAEGCETEISTTQKELEAEIVKHAVSYFSVCVPEDTMAFPRIATPTLYFFLPGNQTPAFWRAFPFTHSVSTDVDILMKMQAGKTYEEARFSDSERLQIAEVDEILENEKTSLQSFPSTFQQARNLAKEMWKSGKRAARGLPVLVSTEVGFQRLTTCEGCDRFEKDTSRCRECGCFMKTKTQLASASCPIGKWSAV